MSSVDRDDFCADALRQLYEYLDGELTEERRVLIAQHLELCSPCGEVFVFETELRRVVANRCKDSVPEQLKRRVYEMLVRLLDDQGTGSTL